MKAFFFILFLTPWMCNAQIGDSLLQLIRAGTEAASIAKEQLPLKGRPLFLTPILKIYSSAAPSSVIFACLFIQIINML